MRRNLGREIDKAARYSAVKMSGIIVRSAESDVQSIGKDASDRYLSATITVPAVNGYADLGVKPIVAGTTTVVIGTKTYTRGVDYVEDIINGRIQNKTMPVGNSAKVDFFYPEQTTGGTGTGTNDHGALIGLADDDHKLYALADGTRGAFIPVNLQGLEGEFVMKTATGYALVGIPSGPVSKSDVKYATLLKFGV